MAFRLLIARGLNEGQQFIAVQPEVLIGRASGNDVVLSDDGVSGMHARIVERGGRYVVEDLGTSNGTFLNGERVAGERELKSGDTIAVGMAVVQFGVELEGPVRKKLLPEAVVSPTKQTGEFAALKPRGDDDAEETVPAGRKDLSARRETAPETPRPDAGTDANTAALSQAEIQAALDEREGPLRPKLKPGGKPVNARTSTTDALEEITQPKPVAAPPFEAGTDVSAKALAPDELDRALPKLGSSLKSLPVLRRSGPLAPPVPDEETVINGPVPKRPAAEAPTVVRPSAPRPPAAEARNAPVDAPALRPSGRQPTLSQAELARRAVEAPTDRPSGRHSLVDMTSDAVLIDAPPSGLRNIDPPTGPLQLDPPTGPIPVARPSGPRPPPPPAPTVSSAGVEQAREGSRLTVDAASDPSLKVRERGFDVSPSPEAVTGPMDVKSIAQVLVSASGALRKPPDLSHAETEVRPRLFEAELPTGDEDLDDAAGDETVSRRAEDPAESPAQRARRRREAQRSLSGQVGWLWSELPRPARLAAGALLAVGACGLAVGAYQLTRGAGHQDLAHEPTTLTGTPVDRSFGFGSVDYERADFKDFRFEVKAPTAAAVLLHYQAQDISANEVSISVNGTELGFVPADVGLPERELEQLVSKFIVKRDDTNLVVFDNVKNPPGHERWRVSRLWLELIPVPDTSREAALAAANAAYERALAIEKLPGAGDELLFKAWRAYREGWIALLSLPDEERGPLFSELKQHADALRLKLDSKCGALMLEAKKQMELGKPNAARAVLQEVLRNFPARDHPCPSLAEEKLAEYDL